MMNKKTQLIFRMIIEAILTIGLAIEGNFWAVAGWALLFLTNMGTLIDVIIEENKNQHPKIK